MANMSKANLKMLTTIELLTEKNKTASLTSHELVRLINAKLNVENKTLSGVFKNVCVSPSGDIKELVALMCNGVIPTFSTFKVEMLRKDPDRDFFSNYDGLLTLSRLSKSALLADKIAKQGGTVPPKA